MGIIYSYLSNLSFRYCISFSYSSHLVYKSCSVFLDALSVSYVLMSISLSYCYKFWSILLTTIVYVGWQLSRVALMGDILSLDGV